MTEPGHLPASKGQPESITAEAEYIEISYQPGRGDPARVFRAMAGLIEAAYQLDRELARSVSVTIEPVLVLERVEAGSIRAVLRRILRVLDDDALRNVDWRPLIGQYLVRGKHRLLRWLGERDQLPNIGQVRELQNELLDLVPADELEGQLLPAPIPPDRLLSGMQRVTEATHELEEGDDARYVAQGESTPIHSAFGITAEDIERLLTDEIVSSQAELVFLIKKPDYLGTSRWEFRYEDHVIEAKILDEPWLQRFHARAFPLAPGDALRVRVRTEVNRGFEGNVVAARYFIERVFEIIPGDLSQQMPLLPPTKPG